MRRASPLNAAENEPGSGTVQTAAAPRSTFFAAARINWMLAGTVLLSAWLLFQVQPMASKRILPWFGGGPAVWTTAMLFFQALLLIGYLYAHLSDRWLNARAQARLHSVLLVIAIGLLIVYGAVAGDEWKPRGIDRPQLEILTILLVSIGLPFALLAATAPLVQTWWGRASGGRSPYRLYALSNAGSLAALVSYPLLFEPLLGVRTQGVLWSVSFAVFAVLCAGSAWATSRASMTHAAHFVVKTPALGDRKVADLTVLSCGLWFAMPCCASVMLLAVTTYICQDVAPVPLLWIGPLVIYLLTFIIAFDSDRWYQRWFWIPALCISSFAAVSSWSPESGYAFGTQVAIHLALLMAVGMICHGEVARMRPATHCLTFYYLCLAAGGAIGGLFVAVIAPLWFVDYYELPISMLAAWILAMCVLISDPASALYKGSNRLAWFAMVVLAALLAILARAQFAGARAYSIAEQRNFFGVLKVQDGEHYDTGLPYRRMLHGRISHGSQFLDSNLRSTPTQYFDHASGVGQLLDSLAGDEPLRVGIVGLGVGTLAAYGNSGDEFTFYELNPQVIDFADRYFTYLDDARGRGVALRIVAGDARLALEREPPQQFDVLVLDAFTGDAIPVHLLTMEAFQLSLRHLHTPNGVLAVHISNRNLDLAPVVQSAADQFNLDAHVVQRSSNPATAVLASKWILLYSRDNASQHERIGQPLVLTQEQSVPIVWTDDYSSLLRVLKSK